MADEWDQAMAAAMDSARGLAAFAAENDTDALFALVRTLDPREAGMTFLALSHLAANYCTMHSLSMGVPADRVPEVIRSQIGARRA